MELRQLQHYIAVIEHGTYTKAAKALDISQPALTASIARLEEDLNARLLSRGQFGAVPTEYGLLLAKRARLIIAEMRLARYELEAQKGSERGHLKLGVGPFFAQFVVPEAVRRINESNPGICVEIFENTSTVLFDKLSRGDLDIVVSTPSLTAEHAPELTQQVLFRSDDVLIVRVGHPLLGKSAVTAVDLVRYPWIVSASVDGIRRAVFSILAAEVSELPRTVVRTDCMSVAQYLLQNGDYITIANARGTPLAHDQSRVAILPYRDLNLRRLGAITTRHRSPPSAATKQFISIFMSVCDEQKLLDPNVERRRSESNLSP